jgi:1-acyl-sn-glycerol-3-phosphate acyltransferase
VLYWVLKKGLLGPTLRGIYDPWVEGLEHVPATGGAIFASNHLSFSDSIFLPLVVPRRITFLAKADYFTGGGVKGRATAGFMKGVGQVPIERGGGNASASALSTGIRILKSGEMLGLYPEGTRSPDGRLYRGKTGVARIALEAGVPVLPTAMIGTDVVQPTGQKIPNRGKGIVGVRIGEPLDFSRYEGMESDRFVLRSITDEIMYELMDLSGQEYVDMYAAKAKAEIEAARRGDAGVVRGPGAPSAAAASTDTASRAAS